MSHKYQAKDDAVTVSRHSQPNLTAEIHSSIIFCCGSLPVMCFSIPQNTTLKLLWTCTELHKNAARYIRIQQTVEAAGLSHRNSCSWRIKRWEMGWSSQPPALTPSDEGTVFHFSFTVASQWCHTCHTCQGEPPPGVTRKAYLKVTPMRCCALLCVMNDHLCNLLTRTPNFTCHMGKWKSLIVLIVVAYIQKTVKAGTLTTSFGRASWKQYQT